MKVVLNKDEKSHSIELIPENKEEAYFLTEFDTKYHYGYQKIFSKFIKNGFSKIIIKKYNR